MQAPREKSPSIFETPKQLRTSDVQSVHNGDEGMKLRQEPAGDGALTEWVENLHPSLLSGQG